MMMLKITQSQLNILCDHAQRCYPEECCGLLLGQAKKVLEVWQTENSWVAEFTETFVSPISQGDAQASRLNRFAIAPEAILQAQKSARDRQLNIIGIYHSHPDHVAVPSEYDRAIAWDVYSYLILSVESHQTLDIRSWVLDEHRQFQEEKIHIYP